jgi:hypothetical protein
VTECELDETNCLRDVVDKELLPGPIPEDGALGHGIEAFEVEPQPAKVLGGFAMTPDRRGGPRRYRSELDQLVDVAGLAGMVDQHLEDPAVRRHRLADRHRCHDGASYQFVTERDRIGPDLEQAAALALVELTLNRPAKI